jgi:hypothetical protein
MSRPAISLPGIVAGQGRRGPCEAGGMIIADRDLDRCGDPEKRKQPETDAKGEPSVEARDNAPEQ